jgi:hypothetical protein
MLWPHQSERTNNFAFGIQCHEMVGFLVEIVHGEVVEVSLIYQAAQLECPNALAFISQLES